MQPTITLRQTLLWLIAAAIASCSKDSNHPETSNQFNPDPETLDIPATFQQNILLHGFTATSCNSCPVLEEMAQRTVKNFKGRLSALMLHRDTLGIAAGDSVFKFFHITGIPAWFYFPVMPDSTTFITMTQRFGISIATSVQGDSAFVKVVTGFSEDVTTPVKIAVWLTEDSVTGTRQSNSYNSDSALPFYNLVSTMDSYYHNHVLRKVISSSVFGDLISNNRTVRGVRDIRKYRFLIPEGLVRQRLKVIAFAYTGVYLYGMVNNVNETRLGENVLWN